MPKFFFMLVTLATLLSLPLGTNPYILRASAVETFNIDTSPYPDQFIPGDVLPPLDRPGGPALSLLAVNYPPDPTSDIGWAGGYAGVADIETAFNNARSFENNQLGTTIPMLSLPVQATWDAMNDGEKALWLINRERIDRGGAPLHGLELNVTGVAQYYATYLVDNNVWGHYEDGRDPWQRLGDNPAIGACRDFLGVAENLAMFMTSGSSIPLPIERSVFLWMYDDGDCCTWGHRHAILWSAYTDNSGVAGREGFLGIGRASGPFTYGGTAWNFAEMIVMNVFDPCQSWSYQAPAAEFVASATSGLAPLTVVFTDQSVGDIGDRSWGFGDGSVSSAANPSHTYCAPGSYTVTLKVTGPGGENTVIKTDLVLVAEGAPVYSALVTKYYNDILDRMPDGGGLAYWMDEIERIACLGIDAKDGLVALAKLFLNSEEYLSRNKTDDAYVIDLYETFLDRTPSPTEVDSWSGLLDLGLSRNVLLNYFAYCEEFRLFMESVLGPGATRPENSLVNDFYRGFLNRLPDSAGYLAWVDRMQDAQCAGSQAIGDLSQEITSGFVDSPEYLLRARSDREFVEDLYNGILKRGAQPEEFNYWLGWMAQGHTAGEVLQFFINSDEFQLKVQELLNAGCVD